jgi:hypothetical protein
MNQSLPKHEIKNCPRCQAAFECKAGDIAHCQCYHTQVPDHVQDLIAKKYSDCLCRQCLVQLSQPINYTMEMHHHLKQR